MELSKLPRILSKYRLAKDDAIQQSIDGQIAVSDLRGLYREGGQPGGVDAYFDTSFNFRCICSKESLRNGP